MPIYEYQCGQCHHGYDRKEGFDAPVEHPCPRCGGTARRLFRPPVILFKGPGFYSTDNRKGSWSDDSSRDGHKASETTTKEPLEAAEK